MTEDRGERWDDTKKAWDEVGELFSELGRRVSERYRALEGEASGAAEEAGRKVNVAVQGVVGKLDQALTSVGDTLRDPEAKESLRHAVRTFGQALEATFSGLARGMRKNDA